MEMTSERELFEDSSEIAAKNAVSIERGEEGSLPSVPPANSEESHAKSRAKTSLRLRYEAESQVIRKKLGDLESIRKQLGLSQRKMCQLLLVDPSAWTRWTRDGAGGSDSAPPHVYRMLQWYLALEEKYPALDVNFWLNTVAQTRDMKDERADQLTREITDLKERLLAMERGVLERNSRAASAPTNEVSTQHLNANQSMGMPHAESARVNGMGGLAAIPASMLQSSMLESASVRKLLDLDGDDDFDQDAWAVDVASGPGLNSATDLNAGEIMKQDFANHSRDRKTSSRFRKIVSQNWRWVLLLSAIAAATWFGFST